MYHATITTVNRLNSQYSPCWQLSVQASAVTYSELSRIWYFVVFDPDTDTLKPAPLAIRNHVHHLRSVGIVCRQRSLAHHISYLKGALLASGPNLVTSEALPTSKADVQRLDSWLHLSLVKLTQQPSAPDIEDPILPVDALWTATVEPFDKKFTYSDDCKWALRVTKLYSASSITAFNDAAVALDLLT
jgi:hypothetical protein